MDRIKKYFDDLTLEELEKADGRITKRALKYRVLRSLLVMQGVSHDDLKFIMDPETVFVHPQVFEYLRRRLGYGRRGEYDKFYSDDYHEAGDMDAVCDLMDRGVAHKTLRHCLNTAFAVDGLRGRELKNYKHNLRTPMTINMDLNSWEDVYGRRRDPNERYHVRAVRYLYDTYDNVNPEMIGMGIQCAIDGTSSANDLVEKIAKSYKYIVGNWDFENVKEYVERNFICFSDKV